jgi:hypothetical protein
MRRKKNKLFGIGAVVLMILIAATPAVYGDQQVPPNGGNERKCIAPKQGGHESAPDPDGGGDTSTVTIDCGSITIDTGHNPDICDAAPLDNHSIDVGTEGAIVTVEVDYSIQCPGWDDHGYVDIKFDGTDISDSADSGETKSGTLTISKFFNPSESFTVTLHAKIVYTYSDGSEDFGISHCDTAPGGNDPNPVLQLTPTEYQFPDTVQHYTSAEYPFTLKNTGTGTARGSVYINGDYASDFQITRTSTGSTTIELDREETMTIYVVFAPQSQGWKTATLTADGSNCDDVASSLTGEGKVV